MFPLSLPSEGEPKGGKKKIQTRMRLSQAVRFFQRVSGDNALGAKCCVRTKFDQLPQSSSELSATMVLSRTMFSEHYIDEGSTSQTFGANHSSTQVNLSQNLLKD